MTTPVTEAPRSLLHHKIKTTEKYWVERARNNPIDFIIYMTDGEKPPAPHHIEWMRLFFNFSIRRLIIQAFPSSAKTSIMIFCMAYIIGILPWLTHMICSVSEGQSKERLAEIREIIQSPRYQNVFPHIHIDLKRPNNATMLNVWSSKLPGYTHAVDYSTYRTYVFRYGEKRDQTVFATGVTSKGITGKRISGIALIDDPHDSTNSATSEQRAKVTSSIHKEILSRLTPSPNGDYTKAVIIMTPWAEDDCSGRLMEARNRDGSPIWTLKKTPVRDEAGNPTWGDVWSTERINAREDEESIIFDLMYMLNPVAMAGKKITLDMLRKPLPNPLPLLKDITITTDLAATERQRSDFTVYHAVARDFQKPCNYYILASRRFKKEQVNDRVELLAEFAEEIFQRYEMLTKIIFEPDAKEEMQLLQAAHLDLPCEMVLIKGDKESRFKAPEAMIQQGRFYFQTQGDKETISVYNALCSELIGFPKAKHDDCVDPLSLLFQQQGWNKTIMRSHLRTIKSPWLL
ncbi:MAG: hypothetical protein ABI835_02845 [Chloroflexota bacterium]